MGWLCAVHTGHLALEITPDLIKSRGIRLPDITSKPHFLVSDTLTLQYRGPMDNLGPTSPKIKNARTHVQKKSPLCEQ